MMRTFICFELPDEVKEKLSEILKEARKYRDLIRWIPPGNVHLTLKFLGDTSKDQLDAIYKALENIAQKHSPLSITFDRLGLFPNFRTPRIFWVGARNAPEDLEALVAGLETSLSEEGFEKEQRIFRPHLTLGRTKDRQIRDTLNFWRHYRVEPMTMDFNELVFMQSETELTGPVYTPLKKFPLNES